MKRHPPIAPLGHLERPLIGGKAFGCSRSGCHAVRLRGLPWSRGCAVDDAPVNGDETVPSSVYRGVNKDGT
jgi:hypothetical protein